MAAKFADELRVTFGDEVERIAQVKTGNRAAFAIECIEFCRQLGRSALARSQRACYRLAGRQYRATYHPAS